MAINRIQSGKSILATLPPPPKLSRFIKKGVLKTDEAIAYDLENDRWWLETQHLLKTQWLAQLE